MSNEEWWAAERKAAEFWQRLKENQSREHHQHPGTGLGRGEAGVMSPAAGFASTLARLRDYRDFEH